MFRKYCEITPVYIFALKKQVHLSVYIQRWRGLQHLVMLNVPEIKVLYKLIRKAAS
jgi:hypothetical protein